MGVPLNGVPEVDVPAEEGEVAEVAEAAVVLICRGLGAALRCDLEGGNQNVSGAFQEVQEKGKKGGEKGRRTFSPDLTLGRGCWVGIAPDAGLRWDYLGRRIEAGSRRVHRPAARAATFPCLRPATLEEEEEQSPLTLAISTAQTPTQQWTAVEVLQWWGGVFEATRVHRRIASFEEPGFREISRRTFGRMGEALGRGGMKAVGGIKYSQENWDSGIRGNNQPWVEARSGGDSADVVEEDGEED